jgi:hypothetical protein
MNIHRFCVFHTNTHMHETKRNELKFKQTTRLSQFNLNNEK